MHLQSKLEITTMCPLLYVLFICTRRGISLVIAIKVLKSVEIHLTTSNMHLKYEAVEVMREFALPVCVGKYNKRHIKHVHEIYSLFTNSTYQ